MTITRRTVEDLRRSTQLCIAAAIAMNSRADETIAAKITVSNPTEATRAADGMQISSTGMITFDFFFFFKYHFYTYGEGVFKRFD